MADRGVRLVEATSVADFLERYYRRDRLTETLLASYEEQFRQDGYVHTSRYDNVTGQHIAWPVLPEWAREEGAVHA